MITALCIITVFGLALGLWNEISEQRRLSRMARDFKAGGKKA